MIRVRQLDGVRIAVADRADLDGVRAAAFADLSAAERERLDLMGDARADEHLLGRHLLRTLVRELGGLAPEDPVGVVARCPRCSGPHGRPVVVDGAVHVSVAHAGGLVVAAAVPTAVASAVGIDVEPLPAGDEAASRAVVAWTRYEAVVKAEGVGVVANRGTTAPEELDRLVRDLPRRFVVRELTLPGYALAVAHAVA